MTLKIASITKNKRLLKLPKTFSQLKESVEKQIKEERPKFSSNPDPSAERDYIIRYIDGDQELINISDDDDLYTAYDVAGKELGGKLSLKIDFKEPIDLLSQSVRMSDPPLFSRGESLSSTVKQAQTAQIEPE